MKLALVCLLLGIGMLKPVLACGPTPQKVVEQVEISTSAHAVRNLLQQSALRAQWHPMIQAVALQPDNTRHIQLHNGWTLVESLRPSADDAVLEDSMLQAGNFPVSQYRGLIKLRVLSAQRVLVSWTARFNGLNTLPEATGQNSAAGSEAMTEYYRQGLAGLKRYLEQLPAQTENND